MLCSCKQDDAPLASLPLLGYSVSCPEDKDAIAKDYVFKLQFKTHVYFFRAESEYTFGRYVELNNHRKSLNFDICVLQYVLGGWKL